MDLSFITEAPSYVWPLLAYLIWGGLRARKTSIVPWKMLLILPVAMLAWTIWGAPSLMLIAPALLLGVWLGALTIRRLELRFDKTRHLIEVSGSTWPLALSLSIFFLKYSLGAAYAYHPEFAGTALALSLEFLATVVSGMFAGRLIGYFRRYKTSSHVDLQEEVQSQPPKQ